MTNRNLRCDTFRMTPEKNSSLLKAEEQPSDEIKVKILLKSVSLVRLEDLNKLLRPDNMTASPDATNKKAIIVRGIPPKNGYGAQDILKVVRKFDTEARIIQ